MFRILIVNLSLIVFCMLSKESFAQPIYNNCSDALYLCPLVVENVTNYDATKTLCAGCEDDFNYCFTPTNSIWMKFETNALGGNVNVNFNNVTIEIAPNQGTEMQATIVQAIAPCDASTYTQIGSCEFAAAGNFVLSATGLLPNTTYYIVVNGATNAPATIPAQATMDISVSGNGVQRIPPGLALFVPSNLICAGEPQLFSAYAGDCPDTTDYYWYINDQLVAVTQSNDFETSALKNGDVLSVTTTCFEYCIVEIADTSAPFAVVTITVDAGPDFTINAGGSVVLQGSTSESSHFWTPSFTLSNPGLLSPIAQPDETTYYYLSATNGACTVTDEAVVYVNDKLSITNTFTPNGDGYNDTWEIPSLEQYSNCFVEIYDRWGQSIFQTTGYNAKKAWDGKHKGKLLEAGVYFYVIEVRDPDFTEPIRGSLTMIR